MPRKKTPDVLSDLMAGPASQKTSKTAKKQTSRPARQPRTPAPRPASCEATRGSERTKATFYISGAGLDALEASWSLLRSQAGSSRGQITKSSLVEVALGRLRQELKDSSARTKLLQDVLKASR